MKAILKSFLFLILSTSMSSCFEVVDEYLAISLFIRDHISGPIDSLKDYADKSISDLVFSKSKDIFPDKTPKSKEEFLYRSIFL